MELQQQLEQALQPYFKHKTGNSYRYTCPWRAGADGETLAVDWSAGKWYDHKDETGGHLQSLARNMGIEVSRSERALATDTKISYKNMAEYARAHGIEPSRMATYKWQEVTHADRRAMRFWTPSGTRYRFLDGAQPHYMSQRGYKPCWYGIGGNFLERMIRNGFAVLCNGEISTIAGIEHDLAAFCVTSGEKVIPDDLLSQIDDLQQDQIIVALDCDEKGRKTAVAIVQQLRARGFTHVYAVDLGLTDGGDLADFCQLHGSDVIEALLTAPVLDVPASRVEQPSPAAPAPAPQIRERFRCVPFADMRMIPPPVWLVEGVIQQGGFNVIFGPSGSGKSYLAIHYAFQLAQQQRVMYVAGEGISGLYQRGLAWMAQHGGHAGNVLMTLGTVEFMNDIEFMKFRALVNEMQPAVIFIDTLARALTGADENNSRDMGIFISRCNELQDAGVTLVIIHHTNKGGFAERGSGAFRAAADVMVRVYMNDGDIDMECEKVKETDPFETVGWSLIKREVCVPQPDGTEVLKPVSVIIPREMKTDSPTDRLTPNQRKVLEVFTLEVFGGVLSLSDIADQLPDLGKPQLHRVLSALMRRKFVAQNGKRAPYELTLFGKEALGIEPVDSATSSVNTVNTAKSDNTVNDFGTLQKVGVVPIQRPDWDESEITPDMFGDEPGLYPNRET